MEIDPQLKSQLFGALSGEIRNMIYAEFWAVSGHRQHVFEAVGGRMSHFPCAMHAGEDDYRNEAFDEVWYRAQTKRPRAVVRSTIWAHRMSSSWNDHWRCEEAMMEARAQGKSAGTLFLPVILTCRRMKEECLPMLYRSTTLILTSLPLSHRLLVSSPSPYICHLRSLDLSLSITFTSLHNHKYVFRPHAQANPPSQLQQQQQDHHHHHPPEPQHFLWSDVCVALSNLAHVAGLTDLTLRLDVADDDRFWWECRETWVLGALRGRVRGLTRIRLPEITADVERLRAYQFEPSPRPPRRGDLRPDDGGGGGGGGGAIKDDNKSNLGDTATRVYRTEYSSSSSSSSHVRSPASRQPSDFLSLERYERRRWTREGLAATTAAAAAACTDGHEDGVRARLEFLGARGYAVAAALGSEYETQLVEMGIKGLGPVRGMLLG